jgi:type I restriction-modification system DNA methylase subunit
MTKEEAKEKIAELLSKYEHLGPSEVKDYHEAKTKQGFVLPLFQYLGWDVFNTDEVAPEEKASKGRVDYAFKLGGVSHFYLEAKPLRADLNKPEYKEQVVTYAYNKGVTWAALTDFEGIQVFNAQTGQRFLSLNHKDYLTNFDKLWLLSRESTASGLLNKEAAQYGALPPSITIEKRLFEQLRQWREELFTQVYHYNPGLSFEKIDEIIQRFFDRLIFIRTCEDRGIEEKTLLSALNQWKTGGHKGEVIESVRGIFRQFDGYYDSDLFLLHPVDQVYIESPTIERIIAGLYQIPGGLASYDFSIIDADVLGAVYEQYLGYVAQIVKQRAKEAQAKLDLGIRTESISLTEKRERRKEHGIYYTPKFVTDYIIKETVGRFLKERSYNEIRNIKILDPACGSGSFLIRAFDELLKYYAGQKVSKSENDIDAADRISILTSNIFGVDLDIQAIEIARLNLLLRSLAKRETLPSLTDNICQGNSLISGTDEELKGYFGDNWQEKKTFNWEEEFPDIMKNGGFDIVIGNPPWVESKRMNNPEKTYYEAAFQSMHGQYDIFNGFVERGLQLLKNKGILGFIIPSRFVMNPDYEPFRKMLLEKTRILNICDVGEHIFEGVEMPALIIILEKQQDSALRSTNSICIRTDIKNLTTKSWNEYQVIQKRFENETNYLFTIYQRPEIDGIIRRIEEGSTKFGDLVNNARGVEIGKKNELVSSKQRDSEYVPFLMK